MGLAEAIIFGVCTAVLIACTIYGLYLVGKDQLCEERVILSAW